MAECHPCVVGVWSFVENVGFQELQLSGVEEGVTSKREHKLVSVTKPEQTSKPGMLFYSFFKTLVGKEVCVEMKNDVVLTGILLSVDQYLNVKLASVSVVDAESHPQLAAMKNCFIRGSVVRYIQIPSNEVDTELLQDAARKEILAK